MEFVHLGANSWLEGDVEIGALRVRHQANTYGYRVGVAGSSLAYVPDNELVGGDYPLEAKRTYRELVGFLGGVDVLFHDAMFTDAEYTRREGWGHSTFSQAVRLAEEAGVGRLQLFHHAPERTDAELSRILEELREDIARRGSRLEIGVAAEGEELIC
jgi:ribonuclease BN (tRNA processing enzyme)